MFIVGSWDIFSNAVLLGYIQVYFSTLTGSTTRTWEFHQHLPKLLKPGGIYSYFNGLCGDNAFFHVVYCQLVAMELANLGYSTQFIPLPVKDCLPDEVWKGVKQKYWQLDTYHLPVCQSESESEWNSTEERGVSPICIWSFWTVFWLVQACCVSTK